ncbi:MAG: hypothetical protein QW057_02905 [Candidatus Bathyarchaeia archaeon]
MLKGEGGRAKAVASVAVFAGLAAYLALLNLVVPYPVLPYLRFEASEIPVMVAFFVAGPIPAMSAAVVYWMILTAVGEWSPIGPALKFAAVASTLLGLWAGIAVYSRVAKRRCSSALSVSSAVITAIATRVAVCSLTNYVVIWVLFPFFLGLATGALKASLAIEAASPLAALFWISLFTGIYNAVHVLVSVLPAYAVVKTWKRVGGARLGIPWIATATGEKKAL